MPDEIILTADDSTNEGCPLLTKTRVIIATKGLCSVVEWQVRDKSGQPMDLGDWICADSDGDSEYDESELESSEPYPLCGQVIFRFADAASPSYVYQAIGWSPDPETGIVRVQLPADLVAYPGLYLMQVGISAQTSADVYTLKYIDKGILSIERSLFGSVDLGDLLGPPTLQEIRIALRDSGLENSLLSDVEFDDTEILHALARPLRQWNETPPPIAYFDSRSFPYHEHWLKATMALLMRSAAYWYERNRLATSAGGVTVDDKNKMQTYMLMAQGLYKEWEQFIIDKKVSINVARCYGIVSSPYG
jgi:hypothetical protein